MEFQLSKLVNVIKLNSLKSIPKFISDCDKGFEKGLNKVNVLGTSVFLVVFKATGTIFKLVLQNVYI
uniref:Uncharacterized protein n=1 Tax=Rhizophagus irregularis (strain DAOM 181602 / DAOM 197198 / MUCL 43194) TaxID=747089 RepID=U9TIJ2_RHIID